MPTVYASGTPNADGYLQGLGVPTASSLISQMRDIFTQAGKNVDDSSIGGNILEIEGDDNGDKYILKLSIEDVNSNEKKLVLIGDFNGQGTLKSDPVEIPFYEGVGARLYLSSDSGGGIACIVNGGLESKSAHFGFPIRSTADQNSWFVGLLDVWQDSCQIAQDPYGNQWLSIHKYFYAAAESHTAPTYGGYQLLWDSLTTGLAGNGTSSYNSSGTVRNTLYKPWLGVVDSITGKPNLDKYGYLIGRLPYNTAYPVPGYGTEAETAVPLHFPGAIRFARTGVASLDTSLQYQISGSSKIVMSGGGKGEYQGFLIAG